MIFTVLDKIENFKYIYNDGTDWVICWDFTEMLNPVIELQNGKLVETSKVSTGAASWKTYRFNHKPSLLEIQNVIMEHINSETTFNIVNCFTWKGYSVQLTTINQSNYKTIYDLAVQSKGASLPVTIKLVKGSDNYYYTFNDLDDLTDFYSKSVSHINNCLSKGWKRKDAINLDNYNI